MPETEYERLDSVLQKRTRVKCSIIDALLNEEEHKSNIKRLMQLAGYGRKTITEFTQELHENNIINLVPSGNEVYAVLTIQPEVIQKNKKFNEWKKNEKNNTGELDYKKHVDEGKPLTIKNLPEIKKYYHGMLHDIIEGVYSEPVMFILHHNEMVFKEVVQSIEQKLIEASHKQDIIFIIPEDFSKPILKRIDDNPNENNLGMVSWVCVKDPIFPNIGVVIHRGISFLVSSLSEQGRAYAIFDKKISEQQWDHYINLLKKLNEMELAYFDRAISINPPAFLPKELKPEKREEQITINSNKNPKQD